MSRLDLPDPAAVDTELQRLASSVQTLFDDVDGKADKLGLEMLRVSKADKDEINKKADTESIEAIEAFFKSRMEDLERLKNDFESATSSEDLTKLRREIENEFKKVRTSVLCARSQMTLRLLFTKPHAKITTAWLVPLQDAQGPLREETPRRRPCDVEVPHVWPRLHGSSGRFLCFRRKEAQIAPKHSAPEEQNIRGWLLRDWDGPRSVLSDSQCDFRPGISNVGSRGSSGECRIFGAYLFVWHLLSH